MDIQAIANNVGSEVLRAREQWGVDFDSKNTLNDWVVYVNIYLAKATAMGASEEEVKKGLRKAAGLVFSALYHAENGGFAPRHYDGQARPQSLPEIKV
jgi:hypothetical protein